ncbi:MAG: transglycosylase domain-containing protein [Verrucomicrobiales bacterium]|nr:transglycosylase domain-containing protein [Verrucomicrobiales bacterium]
MSSDFEDNDFEAIGSGGSPKETVIKLPPLSEKAQQKVKRKRRIIFWLKFTGFCFVLFLVVGIIGLAGAFFYCKPRYDLAQSFDLSELEKVEIASRIFDRNGDELGRIFVQNRRPVTLDGISDNLVNALLAAEDSRFYEHNGVDYWGILRAVYYAARSKEWNQGASTITQQLAKQTFELKDRTMSRKVTEVFLAQRIEKALGSKQKILELYLNKIYFGSGYYGVASASEGYFGKDPSRLSVVEGATLAACIPNPYHRSPRSFPETSMRWRNHVLSRMEAEGYIDKDTLKRSREVAIRTEEKKNITGKSAFVYEKVRQEVIDLLGDETVSKGGFQIHTTIDGSVQGIAETALQEQLTKIEQHPDFTHSTLAQYKAKKAEFRKSATPDQTFPAPEYLQGAILLIENKTGSVIAQVGGRDFSDSMFDRVNQGSRPVGTAFKPFVYAAAFESGQFPGTLVDDTPMDTRQVMIGGTTGILGEWGPENLENTYENRITARTALAKSKNAASVRIGQKIGTEPVVALAESAGMKFAGDLKKFNATFLGRNPASPEDLCLAYTIFPNNGRRPEKTHIIANIKDSVGNLIYSPNVNLKSEAVIDRYTAYQINSILEDTFDTDLGGTGAMAIEKYGLGDFPIAGKTGTEYNFTDNWFVGYTSEVTCVVWAGFDQTEQIYPRAFSSYTVLPVWTKIMNAAAERFEPRAFLPPPEAEQVEVCLRSGELASNDCYETVDKGDGISSQIRTTYIEYLRPGTNLEHICSIHGRGGSRLRNLTKQTQGGPLRATYIVDNADPVFPIAPTVIGTDDPYGSVQPLIRARVAASVITATPVDEAEAEPVDANGIPLARPVMTKTETEDLPAQRVQLPPPRAIEFD